MELYRYNKVSITYNHKNICIGSIWYKPKTVNGNNVFINTICNHECNYKKQEGHICLNTKERSFHSENYMDKIPDEEITEEMLAAVSVKKLLGEID